MLSVDEGGWGLLRGGFVGASGEEGAARTRDIYIPGLLPSLQPLLMPTPSHSLPGTLPSGQAATCSSSVFTATHIVPHCVLLSDQTAFRLLFQSLRQHPEWKPPRLTRRQGVCPSKPMVGPTIMGNGPFSIRGNFSAPRLLKSQTFLSSWY